ncbi:GNAT family N-acetyltransferase [Kitasatospora atroaurantiaca]|uniref:CelD/BcsL family acetyltransferase involved in cellulose biosynthesis n=1 Tax=Kitasatospora atroaurantiaca TaxID=285545 RepID=A0A561EYV2_9ACTN|nr:GNAT family N-acetyltransferase [Kitasatospora atroaurantiaca]TWE20788.1 CelD/BcsL family acetyltransferase involved in cellulose biosynthesis [Kitasatospora atroaurantiaca]
MTRPADPSSALAAQATPGLQVHRTPGTLAPLEPGWRDLVASLPGSSYFMTPDWVLGAWETMDPDTPATVEVAVWSGPAGRVEAVAPVLRVRGRLHHRLPLPVTSWTLLGYAADAADHGLLPAAPHRREEVRAWLRRRTRWSSFWLPAMDPEADPYLLPPGTRRIARNTCPRLAIGPGAAVGSSGFRKDVRRYERQLAQQEVSFRWVAPPDMTAEVLDAVLRLHRLRQDHKGNTTGFGPERRGFHLRLQQRADADRGPAALVAEHQGTVIGAVYGFLWSNTFAYYNGGWDPAYARLSLGTVLVNRAISAAAEHGVRTFDFLRGDEPYKYRPFGAHDRHDVQWLRPRSLTAVLAGTAIHQHDRRRPHGATPPPPDGSASPEI